MTAQRRLDLAQLKRDIGKAAQIIDIPYNEEQIARNLETFAEYFSTAPVALRTTTHGPEKRNLSVRYLALDRVHDPFAMAVAAGLIKLEGHPIENIVPELQAQFSGVTFGVDVSVKKGFEKIWPFFHGPVPKEEVFALPSIPPSIKNYTEHFAKFDLKWISLLALDYSNKTFNVYFLIPDPSRYPPQTIAAMLEDLGFAVPSQEELEVDSTGFVYYYTFNWESPKVERVCFCAAGPTEVAPIHLHPLFKRWVEEVPCQAPSRGFTYGPTYGERGDYLKFEIDYTGTVGQIIHDVTGEVPL